MAKDRSALILSHVAREIDKNPPKILSRTRRKKGRRAAERQRIAILLAKARRAGAGV